MKRLICGFIAMTLVGLTVAHAKNRRVWIRNDYTSAMDRLYASNSQTTTWRNILDTPIGRNQEREINFTDGTNACRWDLRAEFRNGQTLERYNYNVCEGSEWRVVAK